MLNHLSKTNFKNIEALFLTDYVYLPQGAILDFVHKYFPNINLYTYNVGHKSDTLVINKIESNINNRNPLAPPRNIFKESLEKLDESKKDLKISEISKQLKDLYRTKKWFNYAGTSLYQETKIIDKNSETFSENLENITFAIFPHIYWDISSSAGNDLFKVYKVWFESSVKYILDNTNSIIRDILLICSN